MISSKKRHANIYAAFVSYQNICTRTDNASVIKLGRLWVWLCSGKNIWMSFHFLTKIMTYMGRGQQCSNQ